MQQRLLQHRKNALHVNNKMPRLCWDNGHIWILNWRAMQSADWRLNNTWIDYNFVDLPWQILPSNLFSQKSISYFTHWCIFFSVDCIYYLLVVFLPRLLKAIPSHWVLYTLQWWLRYYTSFKTLLYQSAWLNFFWLWLSSVEIDHLMEMPFSNFTVIK